jgi:phosphoribosyl-ATP pyrophosphohydrolase/phosphoribosyl-AMP cyclohydrolase
MNDILNELYQVILDRKKNPKEGSYTCYLFDKGIDKILKKVGEEASETIIATKNDSKDEIIYEVSDLLYHLMVLLVEKNVSLEQIADELKNRR